MLSRLQRTHFYFFTIHGYFGGNDLPMERKLEAKLKQENGVINKTKAEVSIHYENKGTTIAVFLNQTCPEGSSASLGVSVINDRIIGQECLGWYNNSSGAKRKGIIFYAGLLINRGRVNLI